MFAKKNRLKLKDKMDQLRKKGQWLNFPLFNILCATTKNSTPKAAVVVGSKVSSGSVGRHRVKRLISETVRFKMGRLPAGSEIVVFAKKESSGKNYNEIENEYEKALIKINQVISKNI